jgi:hypothetical protein
VPDTRADRHRLCEKNRYEQVFYDKGLNPKATGACTTPTDVYKASAVKCLPNRDRAGCSPQVLESHAAEAVHVACAYLLHCFWPLVIWEALPQVH